MSNQNDPENRACDETIEVNARIEISADALQIMVAKMKKLAGADDKGIYRIDTFGAVSRMITKFLEEKNFDAYVRDIKNYQGTI